MSKVPDALWLSSADEPQMKVKTKHTFCLRKEALATRVDPDLSRKD